MAIANRTYTQPLKRALINVAAGGAGGLSLVAAVTGKKIRVRQYFLTVSTNVTVRFDSATASPSLSGNMIQPAESVYKDFSDDGLFETDAGDALILEVGGAADVDGYILYVEV